MDVKKIEIPCGLIKTPAPNLDNIDLRVSLEKAVEDANLNVTERLALNEKFFPNGGGFNLFPKNEPIPKNTMYYKPGVPPNDSFTRKAESIKIPKHINIINEIIIKSSKSNFQTNLEHALKKLKRVLQGNI